MEYRTPSVKELSRGTYSVSGSSAMQLYTDVKPLDPCAPSWQSLTDPMARFGIDQTFTPGHFSRGHGYHVDYRVDLVRRFGSDIERRRLLTKRHIEDIE